MVQPFTITIDLDVLAEKIVKQLKTIPTGPTTMSVNDFAQVEKISRNFILEHRDEFCVEKIGGKVVINMIAWREKLRTAGK